MGHAAKERRRDEIHPYRHSLVAASTGCVRALPGLLALDFVGDGPSATAYGIRVHDLRHTFASLLLQQGDSVVYVKDQLGHAPIQLTVDTYGHLIPRANRAAVDRLDDVTMHLSASQAHPEPEDAGAGDQSKSFVFE